jgi:hypothetical protein
MQGDYDDSPWTREELEAQAWELSESAGWEDVGDDQQTNHRGEPTTDAEPLA